jgi:hypothetical protein
MDRIRAYADFSVRRAVFLGLLAIATITATLVKGPEHSLRAIALLLSLEAAMLWQMSRMGLGWVGRMRAVWTLSDPADRPRAERLLRQVMAETLAAWARRVAGAAAAVWVVDGLWRLATN